MLSPRARLICDFLPLAIFFVGFKALGLVYATASLIAATICVLLFMYAKERRVALTPLITGVVVTVFGGLSIYLKDETFIKMKPTVINIIFALVLFIGCWRGKGLLRHVVGTLDLTDRGWWLLSMRFGFFFLTMAVLNECVWRTVPTEWWVDFKVFGLIGFTMLFAVLQTGFIQRFQKTPETGEQL